MAVSKTGTKKLGTEAFGQPVWQCDLEADRDTDNAFTVTQSFICASENAEMYRPSNGSACPVAGYQLAGLSDSKVKLLPGNRAQVYCTWTHSGNSDTSSESEFSGKKKTGYRFGTRNEPIASNPRYKDIGDSEKAIINQLIGGNLKQKGTEAGKFIRADGATNEEFTITTPRGIELSKKILGGITQYYAPSLIYTESYNSKFFRPPNATVGKIDDSCTGKGGGGDGSWLYLGCESQEGQTYFTHTATWEWGGWDSDIYNKT